MLIAMGWNRLVIDTVNAYNLHATVSLDVPNILSKSGPCVTFRNALDCTMKISGKRGLKISATHHRAPSDHEHYKAITSCGMTEGEARPHARRLCYLMGTHLGLRAGAEKYETIKADLKLQCGHKEHGQSQADVDAWREQDKHWRSGDDRAQRERRCFFLPTDGRGIMPKPRGAVLRPS